MSLKPTPIGPVPELTAYVARAAFPDGNPYMSVRDALGTFYDDQRFADLFPDRGGRRGPLAAGPGHRPPVRRGARRPPGRRRRPRPHRLEVRPRPGADRSRLRLLGLCAFRARLVAGGAERLLLEAMLETCKAHGLVKARGKQRTDSTHVLAAIRTLNRLELVGETLRAALNSLATVAPQWLRAWVPPEWFDRYASRIEESRLPKGEEARYAHGEGIGPTASGCSTPSTARTRRGGWATCRPWRSCGGSGWPSITSTRAGCAGGRRATAAGGRRIDSPYDPEATFGNKRSTTWTGYKVHLTETCEDDGGRAGGPSPLVGPPRRPLVCLDEATKQLVGEVANRSRRGRSGRS